MNKLHAFVVGPLEENCYLLWDPGSKKGVVIDPGDDPDTITSFIKNKALHIDSILLTHGHYDHIGAVRQLKDTTGARIYIHHDDERALVDTSQNLSALSDVAVTAVKADRVLTHGDTVAVGYAQYTVIHTPGHTSGGVCFYGEGRLFSGDTLFKEGIGRSDFPGGNGELLIRMIKEKLFTLPEETAVFPGHGPDSTIGWEREHNPFD